MPVARLQLTLSDVAPRALRRVDVSRKIKLTRLHDVIRAAMGWTDSHLCAFWASGLGWGVPGSECDDENPLSARKTRFLDVI